MKIKDVYPDIEYFHGNCNCGYCGEEIKEEDDVAVRDRRIVHEECAEEMKDE